MSESTLTYVFEGDVTHAIHEGKVIASGKDMPSVESDAVKYLESLTQQRDKKEADSRRKKATHIVTPNGIKGEILGRTPTIWGNEITVRFDNGQISKFAAHSEADMKVEWVNDNHKTANTSGPVEKLAATLDEDYSRDRVGLVDRLSQLRALASEARSFINNGAPYEAEVRLDQIRAAAEYEGIQIKEAIDHLDSADAEIFGAPAPFSMGVAEQESTGQSSDWLDVVTSDMIAESEGQDFEKILHEGPALFVTELDSGALADAGTTQEMAYSHIVSRTAGYQGEDVDNYREQFIAQVEVARRDELASRKDTTYKEAAAQKEAHDNAPDESLFM